MFPLIQKQSKDLINGQGQSKGLKLLPSLNDQQMSPYQIVGVKNNAGRNANSKLRNKQEQLIGLVEDQQSGVRHSDLSIAPSTKVTQVKDDKQYKGTKMISDGSVESLENSQYQMIYHRQSQSNATDIISQSVIPSPKGIQSPNNKNFIISFNSSFTDHVQNSKDETLTQRVESSFKKKFSKVSYSDAFGSPRPPKSGAKGISPFSQQKSQRKNADIGVTSQNPSKFKKFRSECSSPYAKYKVKSKGDAIVEVVFPTDVASRMHMSNGINQLYTDDEKQANIFNFEDFLKEQIHEAEQNDTRPTQEVSNNNGSQVSDYNDYQSPKQFFRGASHTSANGHKHQAFSDNSNVDDYIYTEENQTAKFMSSQKSPTALDNSIGLEHLVRELEASEGDIKEPVLQYYIEKIKSQQQKSQLKHRQGQKQSSQMKRRNRTESIDEHVVKSPPVIKDKFQQKFAKEHVDSMASALDKIDYITRLNLKENIVNFLPQDRKSQMQIREESFQQNHTGKASSVEPSRILTSPHNNKSSLGTHNKSMFPKGQTNSIAVKDFSRKEILQPIGLSNRQKREGRIVGNNTLSIKEKGLGLSNQYQDLPESIDYGSGAPKKKVRDRIKSYGRWYLKPIQYNEKFENSQSPKRD